MIVKVINVLKERKVIKYSESQDIQNCVRFFSEVIPDFPGVWKELLFIC